MTIFDHETETVSTQNGARQFTVRRDPFTGALVSAPGAVQVRGRLGRTLQLLPDGAPSGSQHSGVVPGLGSPVACEPLTERLFNEAGARTYLAELFEAAERLVPREEVSEVTAVESGFGGSISADVLGFAEPTAHTELVQTQARAWAEKTGGDLVSDVLVSEIVDGSRLVFKSAHWVAFVPFAAQHSFELMLLPKYPSRTIVATTDEARADLEASYLRIVRLLGEVLGERPAYRATWQMAPIPHCRNISRLRVHFTADLPGSSQVSPEQLAQTLRSYL